MTFNEFTKQHKSIVGYRIKVHGEWFMIGDINALGGSCDDCPMVNYSDEIEDVEEPKGQIHAERGAE